MTSFLLVTTMLEDSSDTFCIQFQSSKENNAHSCPHRTLHKLHVASSLAIPKPFAHCLETCSLTQTQRVGEHSTSATRRHRSDQSLDEQHVLLCIERGRPRIKIAQSGFVNDQFRLTMDLKRLGPSVLSKDPFVEILCVEVIPVYQE